MRIITRENFKNFCLILIIKNEEIADAGREFAMNELNNDKAVEEIIEVINELIK